MVFETKDQIIRRQKLVRYKFKALARKAQLNSYWLTQLDDVDLSENVPTISAIRLKRKGKRGVLTLQDKTLLRKPPAERTEEELKHLVNLLDELPGLKEFSPMIRQELIGAVEFQFYEKDRLILKENHLSLSMYFVLTGEILISRLNHDTETGTYVNRPANYLNTGDCFGHLGLIYNVVRNASASTRSKWVNKKLVAQLYKSGSSA